MNKNKHFDSNVMPLALLRFFVASLFSPFGSSLRLASLLRTVEAAMYYSNASTPTATYRYVLLKRIHSHFAI
jgi:hypothetical protein